LTYAAAIGTCAGLFYLYSEGHNHWLYNPLLFQLWDYADLVGGPNYSTILWHRIYILVLACILVFLAQLVSTQVGTEPLAVASGINKL
jgi:hypothetical protein